MKSLGERLLELRERYVRSKAAFFYQLKMRTDEFDAVLEAENFGHSARDWKLHRTVAIERAAVRELKREGKL